MVCLSPQFGHDASRRFASVILLSSTSVTIFTETPHLQRHEATLAITPSELDGFGSHIQSLSGLASIGFHNVRSRYIRCISLSRSIVLTAFARRPIRDVATLAPRLCSTATTPSMQEFMMMCHIPRDCHGRCSVASLACLKNME
jgi:hypothetical protein